jgi:uncharacterized protein
VNGLGVAAVALVMAVGLIGTFLPLVPGLPLIWGAALAYGLLDGFGGVGWVAMAVITLLLVAGTVAKIVLPHRRASAVGVPRSSLVVAAVAAVIGFFAIPVVGLPLGGAAGLVAAEYRRTRDWASAWRSTKSAIVGFGYGALLELGAGMAMIVCWIAWVVIHR